MPHLIIEYTDNLRETANISELLKKASTALLQHETIPIGGLRVRAIALKDYLVADGTEDDAFVHVTLKLGKGRTEVQLKQIEKDLFTVLTTHFSPIFQSRYLALSMEVYEFRRPTYKQNNIHFRYTKERKN